MSFLSNVRDRFIVQPVVKRITQSINDDIAKKGDVPNIFAVPIGFNNAMSSFNKRMISANVDFAILRTLSINHETTRAAINVRKRQITSLGYDIVDTDDDTPQIKTLAERQKVRDIITNIGGSGVRFRSLLDRLIEDLLVLDALVFYKQRGRGGKLLRIIPIDGATIKLRVGQGGERPLPPDFAFEQWIRGSKVAEMTTEEMSYEMMNPKNDSAYGLSPIESLIITLDSSMRAMLYNLNYLSDNNIPQGFLNMPEGWTVQQMKEYKEWLDAEISGSKNQAKVYPIPSSAAYTPTSKPTDFAFKEFFDYLDRRILMLFDITPQEMGLNLKQYKENAEGQEKIQLRKGIRPLANFLQEIFTDLIQNDLGFPQFAFKFTGIDGRFTLDSATKLVPLGVVSVDEIRNDMGLSKLGIDNYIKVGNALVSVEQLVEDKGFNHQPNQNPDEASVDPNGSTEGEASGHAKLEPLSPTTPSDNSGTKTKIEKLEKASRNLTFEALEKTRKFKSFKQQTKEALTKQIEPFTIAGNVGKITQSQKADMSQTFNEAVASQVNTLSVYFSNEDINKFLKWAAQQGGNRAFESLNVDSTFKLTQPLFQEMLGDRANYLIDSVDATTKDWIVNQIVQGKQASLTNSEIAQNISDDIEQITSRRADMIVNTEVANAMQTAELKAYKAQGLEEKQWVTSEDDRVCPICSSLDEMIVKLDDSFDGFDTPPAHPDCRCYINPVLAPLE